MTATRPTTGHVLTIVPELRESDFHYHEAAVVYGDKAFVICTEGVGREVTDERPTTGRDGATFTRADIVALLADGTERETRPLEDWVRTFGARLESNFYIWHRALDLVRDGLVEAECGEAVAPTAKDGHEAACEWCAEARAEALDETPSFA